jgi:hypothetical protein
MFGRGGYVGVCAGIGASGGTVGIVGGEFGSSVGVSSVNKKTFLASMFYQNIGPSSLYIFIFPGVYFSSKNPVIFCMLIS